MKDKPKMGMGKKPKADKAMDKKQDKKLVKKMVKGSCIK
jgi:hypothetical protein